MAVLSDRDLAANDGIKVGFVPNGSTEQMFKSSSESSERELYHRAIDTRKTIEESITSVDKIISYLRHMPYADFAAILESNTAKFHSHQLPCNLYMVYDASVMTKQLALGFPKGSELRANISRQLLELQENNVLRELEKRWFKSKCESAMFRPESVDDIKIKPFHRLDLTTFSGAVLLLVIGIGVGGLVTLVEICIYRWAETVSFVTRSA